VPRWPYQPQQQWDQNTERTACQRRLVEDDAWVNPHNLRLSMFFPSTVHVLPFDPRYGCDAARLYATKYAGKPEKSYYLETLTEGAKELPPNSVKKLLHCRTVGICMAHNRLLGYKVVRSTRPVVYTPTKFAPPREMSTPRQPGHLTHCPDYPNPNFYLSDTQKYFFRHSALRHLRIEQFNRYFLTARRSGWLSETMEDLAGDEDDHVKVETAHRHYDPWAETVPAGSTYASARQVEGVRKRKQARLAVSRLPFIEPIGTSREDFYEGKLLLALPWYCASGPIGLADGGLLWHFTWSPPEDLGGAHLAQQELTLSPDTAISFEKTCAELEHEFCRQEHNLVCSCCQLGEDSICKACQWAVGFHRCEKAEHLMWRKGTLYGIGDVDIQRVFFNLHLKGLPIDVLREKAPR